MAPHQQRVVDEKQELDAKLEKLEAFISKSDGPIQNLPVDEKIRLVRQEILMRMYSDVLGERIAAFPAA